MNDWLIRHLRAEAKEREYNRQKELDDEKKYRGYAADAAARAYTSLQQAAALNQLADRLESADEQGLSAGSDGAAGCSLPGSPR